MFIFQDIRKNAITDYEWKNYFDLRVLLKKKYDSLFFDFNWEETKSKLNAQLSLEQGLQFSFIYNDNKIIGWAAFNITNIDTEKQSSYINFNVDLINFDNVFFQTLSDYYLTMLGRYNLKYTGMMTFDTRDVNYLNEIGAENLGASDKFILYRINYNKTLADQWIKNTQNKELELKFYINLPERYYVPYTQLFSKCLSEMPEERGSFYSYNITSEQFKVMEQISQKNNMPSMKALLIDKFDNIVGLSQAVLNLNKPTQAFQSMTGVMKNYRGKGHAKWLKASLTNKIFDDFPECNKIITNMRSVNEPIKKINKDIGFKYHKTGYEFRVHRRNLESVSFNKYGVD